MEIKKLVTHPITIIGSIALGVLAGIYAPGWSESLKFVGETYVDLLTMVVLPFLVSAVIVSINRLATDPDASRYVMRVVAYLMAGMALAGVVGIVYMAAVKPGIGMDQSTLRAFGQLVQSDVTGVETSITLLTPVAVGDEDGALTKLLSRMIPNNIFNALSVGDTLKTLFFVVIFGLALASSPSRSNAGFIDGCEVVFKACQRMTTWLLYALPIASFSLAAAQISSTGFEPFRVMAQFTLAFGAATIFLLLLSLAIIWRKSGRTFAQSLSSQEDPFFLAVATRNSASCMPSMMIAMVEKLGFDKTITELLIPLGTALFRVGPVLYYCMATVFIAQLYGRDLAATDYFLILFASLIAGFSSTGMNGIVTISQTAIVCSLLGLPFEAAFVLFVAVEPICDTCRTALLVISINALVAIIAPKSSEDSLDINHTIGISA